MKVAVMQPYFMPYIGYFQLIAAADIFVVFDDVNYIKKGWINRNNLLVNGQAHLFSLPLQDASQNKKIKQIDLQDGALWKSQWLKTVELAYKKAPQFGVVYPMLQEIVAFEEANLSRFIANSLQTVARFLDIDTKFRFSSDIEHGDGKGSDKISDICTRLAATDYINAIGGRELYDVQAFATKGLRLHFIKTAPIAYTQFKNEFIPWLSIVDVLMFNEKSAIQTMLGQYELI